MTKNIKKILVPLDSSENSLRGLDTAISLAQKYQAEVTGVHVPLSFPYGVRVTKKIREEFRKKRRTDC